MNLLKGLFGGGSPPPPTDDGEEQPYADEAQVKADMDELREAATPIRRLQEREWVTGWRFYEGDQWIRWAKDELVSAELDDRPYLVFNLVRRAVRTRLAHLTKNRPIAFAYPATHDEESRSSARVGTKLIDFYWRALKLPRKINEALLWTLICGKCFFKIYWDPNGGEIRRMPGPVVLDPETGQPVMDPNSGEPLLDGNGQPVMGPNGQPMMDPETQQALRHPKEVSRPIGEPCIDIAYPIEILVDPGATCIDNAQKLVHRKLEPIAVVKKRWGDKAKDLQPIDPTSVEGSTLLRNMMGYSPNSKSIGRIEVEECWWKPDPDRYPQGLYAVFAGGKLMYAGPTPEGYAHIPFVELNDLRTKSFWSHGIVRDLIDVNKLINVQISQEEYKRRALRPRVLLPTQSGVDEEAIESDDREVLEYNHPYEPRYMAPPNTPSTDVELRNASLKLFDQQAGNVDIMSGTNPSDVRSGRQTAYLQEYQGTVLGLTAQDVEFAFQDMCGMLLDLIKSNATETRVAQLVGRNRSLEIMEFMGSDLNGVGGVEVQAGSALPTSRVEKHDRIEKWMEMKWISPEKGLKLLGAADPDFEFYETDELHRENADECIQMLLALDKETIGRAAAEADMNAVKKGRPTVPEDILDALGIRAYEADNHEIHVERLNVGLRLTKQYRNGPIAFRSLVDALVDWHRQLEGGLDPLNPPPPAPPMAPGAAPPGAGGPTQPGGPQVLAGGPAAGPGGIGSIQGAQQNGAETAEGLPPVPRVPEPAPNGR